MPKPVGALVLAALEGPSALERLLEKGTLVEFSAPPDAPEPVGAYIDAIAVEGFRGVGERATLGLSPGPGLTLVIGRNGSGKSSFAEALEVLFTGDNQRWSKRSAVWKEGWRNLHHSHAEIEASLAVEGVSGPTVVRREWADGGGLDGSRVEVQPHGQKRTTLSFLGWEQDLSTYRPFLSYSELGSMLDEGPTKLHDAVSSVLGLEELPAAEKALKDARLAREKRLKAVLAQRAEIVGLLESLDDDRARKVRALLQPTYMDLDGIERVVTEPGGDVGAGELGIFNRVSALTFPDDDVVNSAAVELREARSELAGLAGTQADRLLRGASLLEEALAYRDDFGETTCPVCSTPGVLTDEWADAAEQTAREQAAAAAEVSRAKARAEAAVRRARGLLGPVPAPVQEVRGLLDAAAVIEAWREWVGLQDVSESQLAERLVMAANAARAALAALQAQASTEAERRQDAWRPIAVHLAAWLAEARSAQGGAALVADLKKAETWLKREAVDIRNERFAPISEEAAALWRLLRQRSNVQLGRIELAGAGVTRRVVLDVTVDGVAGAALGVMSQGELHALALSLFFPRATLDESPFRFVIVDDPVQSMDPAKIDGLAKVLERAAATRQVIVFTHDDRLPEAVRRLGISATTIEVTRRENSVVELRPALTPVERHIEDARAVVRSVELPDEVRQRVVPGFCRLAIDAACVEAVRRRRLGRGDVHAEVEMLLEGVTRTTVFASLALFDDPTRGGDVLGTINGRFGRRAADAFRRLNKGTHEPVDGDLANLITDSAKLARSLAESA